MNQTHQAIIRNISIFFGIYLLFALSIAVSIGITQYTYFHSFVFNNYVAQKIFLGSLTFTLVLIITTTVFRQLLSFLNIYKTYQGVDIKGNFFMIPTSPILNVFVFLLFSVVALPIKTVITSFYLNDGITYFRFGFVHFDMTIKIISAVFLLGIIVLYITKKYQFSKTNLLLFIILITAPTGYYIWETTNAKFEALSYKIFAIVGEQMFIDGSLVNKVTGEQVKPLAEKLLTLAKTEEEIAEAHSFLALAEMNFGNYSEAMKYITQSLSYKEKSFSYRIKSDIERGMKDFTNARVSAQKCLEFAINENTNTAKARCEATMAMVDTDEARLVYNYQNSNLFKSAQQHLENAIRLDPEHSYYELGLRRLVVDDAVGDFFQKKYDSALSKLNNFIQNNDSYNSPVLLSEAYAARGTVKRFLGDYTGAIQDLEKALTLSDYNTKGIYFDIGFTYDLIKDPHTAILYYDKALLIDSNDKPSNVEILEYKSRIQEGIKFR